MSKTFVPDLLYRDGAFRAGLSVRVEDGRTEDETVRLPGRALVPGLVNAHSHAFQRAIRGTTEERSAAQDNFWSWRNAMYRAANRLDPDDLYRVARMAYLEMALSGITTVGEFHYIHRDPQGHAYEDPNLIGKLMVRAAREVGLRICLLRAAYFRAGFRVEANPLQRRFIEPSVEVYLENLEALRGSLNGEFAWVGAAPHSIRAAPLQQIREIAEWTERARLPLHMHAAEQPAEIVACAAEYGVSPIALLAREGVLSPRFTAVHGIHITEDEIRALAAAGSTVCACPTTERNLGDGVVPAGVLHEAGVRMALGSDSQAQIDILEDARELEYHLRLQTFHRGLVSPTDLLECATAGGSQALQRPSKDGDFFTVDLNDPSLAGSDSGNLAASLVFGASRTAVRDVAVGGQFVIRDRCHTLQEVIVREYRACLARFSDTVRHER